MCTVGIAVFFTKWGCIGKPHFISCCPELGLHSGLLPASRLFLCFVLFLSLAWHCQKMIYFSSFVPQTTNIELQIHRDLTNLLSFPLTSMLPSKQWAWGRGCAFQWDLESVIFHTSHAYLMPAMGLPQLWTVFIGYRFVPDDSPVLIGRLGSLFTIPTAQVFTARIFILHVCFPLTGKKMVFSQTTEVRNANLICY